MPKLKPKAMVKPFAIMWKSGFTMSTTSLLSVMRPSINIFHDVPDVGDLAHVVARHAFRKTRGASGVHDVGEVLPRVDFRRGRFRPVFPDKSPKRIYLLSFFDLALGYLVEEPADNLFPRGTSSTRLVTMTLSSGSSS